MEPWITPTRGSTYQQGTVPAVFGSEQVLATVPPSGVMPLTRLRLANFGDEPTISLKNPWHKVQG